VRQLGEQYFALAFADVETIRVQPRRTQGRDTTRIFFATNDPLRGVLHPIVRVDGKKGNPSKQRRDLEGLTP
jgi:hypothetical protein